MFCLLFRFTYRAIGIVILGSILYALTDHAHSQTITSQRLGPITYYNGRLPDGQEFQGTSQRLGQIDYFESNVGGKRTSCTSQVIGQFVYTNCR